MAMFELKMPKLGESVTEGTIGKWLKQPGDTVAKYDLLVEVQTDKVNTEIPSPVSGTLKEVKVEEGTTVASLFADKVPGRKPADYLIRVNRLPSSADQVLRDGDRVTITPTKIEGA